MNKKLYLVLWLLIISLLAGCSSGTPVSIEITAPASPMLSATPDSLPSPGNVLPTHTPTSPPASELASPTKAAETPSPSPAKATSTSPTTPTQKPATPSPSLETPTPEPETPSPEPASATMVWLSETGSKYHRINKCGNMNPNKARQVTLESAKSDGYGACKNCDPPR